MLSNPLHFYNIPKQDASVIPTGQVVSDLPKAPHQTRGKIQMGRAGLRACIPRLLGLAHVGFTTLSYDTHTTELEPCSGRTPSWLCLEISHKCGRVGQPPLRLQSSSGSEEPHRAPWGGPPWGGLFQVHYLDFQESKEAA